MRPNLAQTGQLPARVGGLLAILLQRARHGQAPAGLDGHRIMQDQLAQVGRLEIPDEQPAGLRIMLHHAR